MFVNLSEKPPFVASHRPDIHVEIFDSRANHYPPTLSQLKRKQLIMNSLQLITTFSLGTPQQPQ